MRKSSADAPLCVDLLKRLAEEQRHALQSHVLEGERRAVPQLEDEATRGDLANRRDCGASKFEP